MFGKEAKENRPANGPVGGGAVNIIGQGTTVQGDIASDGDLRIDGKVIGHVYSKSKVAIGPTGMVEGDVMAENADVSGTVTGTVKSEQLLFLKSTAVVNGDIIIGKLVVESGAVFNGHCKMNAGENRASKPNLAQPVESFK